MLILQSELISYKKQTTDLFCAVKINIQEMKGQQCVYEYVQFILLLYTMLNKYEYKIHKTDYKATAPRNLIVSHQQSSQDISLKLSHAQACLFCFLNPFPLITLFNSQPLICFVII